MVYGYEVSENMKTELVLSSFIKCYKYIKNKFKYQDIHNIIFHQDQGSQYTSYEYVNQILSVSKISYSAKGTPTDNAGQESFFGRFKEEHATEILDIKSFKKVKKFINQKIRYYNNERIHTSIAYTSPKSFTKSLLNSA